MSTPKKTKKKPTSTKGNNSVSKVKVVAAPIALTEDEKLHFICWQEMMHALKWLYATPDDVETKQFVLEFLAYYAKVKAAMNLVEEGKTKCSLGTVKDTGRKLTISKRFFDSAQGEADFVVPFYLTYLASKIGASSSGTNRAIIRMFVDSEERVQELEDEIARKDMRIKDLENAVEKCFKKGHKSTRK